MTTFASPPTLTPVGGTWSGLFFANARAGVERHLSWSFVVRFDDVTHEGESTPVDLTVEWVRLDVDDWRAMAGASAVSPFAEPIEASVYAWMHHRFHEASIEVVAQRGEELDVRIRVDGDIDGLGVERIEVVATLQFEAVRVRVRDVERESDVRAALAGHLCVDGLQITSSGSGFDLRR